MFGPADARPAPSLRPEGCTFRESDWNILASFWHPVAFVHDIGDEPVSAKLLDVDLLLYRADGEIQLVLDRCPHRGMKLSRGKIVEGLLRCPMHGLAFDGEGRCRHIPSIGPVGAAIPGAMRLTTILTETRYGMVWACLSGEPRMPLPNWTCFENPDLETLFFPVEQWAASAGRHVENFNDVAHFPFVHVETFAGDPATTLPRYEVRQTEDGLAFTLPYREGFNRFPDGVPGDARDVTYEYELTYPFSTLLTVAPVDSNYAYWIADVASPASAHVARIYQLATDTTGKPDKELWTADTMLINQEDQPLVEDQYPRDLPLDLRSEVHIPGDRMSIEYRRGLVGRFGLGAS